MHFVAFRDRTVRAFFESTDTLAEIGLEATRSQGCTTTSYSRPPQGVATIDTYVDEDSLPYARAVRCSAHEVALPVQ